MYKFGNLVIVVYLLFGVFQGASFAADNKNEVNHYNTQAQKYILEGKKYYRQHRYNWAISEWKKALKADPGNVEVVAYIEHAEARSRQKPNEREPLEPEMLPGPAAHEIPPGVFERPQKDTVSLEDAIGVGVKNHIPIQVALEQVKLARFKEKETFRQLFPQASVRWDESSGTVSARDYKGRKYQLKLEHPLYRSGELGYAWQQAKVNLKISQENYNKTKEDYIIELTKVYYDYAKAINNFKVQEVLLMELEADISMAKKEFENEITTLVEFLNVQSQYNQTYYAYLSSENAASLAKSNFLQLLNLDQDPAVNIRIDTEMVFKENKIDLEECIKLAYKNRTDLKINELGLESASLGEKVAKSKLLPKVDLTGALGRSGEAFTPGTLQMSDEWFVGAKVSVPWGPNTMEYSYADEHQAPSLSTFQSTLNKMHSVTMNIMDNMAGYTEEKQSEVAKQQAYSDLVKGKQTAASQVREAYFSYQESVLKVKNSLANKELYQKEIAVMKEKRLMNEAQTNDLVEARVKLTQEEVNYNSAIVESVVALAKLNNAIGIKNYFK